MHCLEEAHQIDTYQKNVDQNMLSKDRLNGFNDQEQFLREITKQNTDNNLDLSQFHLQIHSKEKTEPIAKSQERGQV